MLWWEWLVFGVIMFGLIWIAVGFILMPLGLLALLRRRSDDR